MRLIKGIVAVCVTALVFGVPLLISASSYIGREMSIDDGGLVYKTGANFGRGYVGIGISNPTHNFVVSGNIAVHGTVLNCEYLYPALSGTWTLNLSSGNQQFVTINAGTTTITFSNTPSAAALYRVGVSYGAVNATVSWPSGTKFPRGESPSLSNDSVGNVDWFYLFYDGLASEGGTNSYFVIREYGSTRNNGI